jgi:hypothetical protein
MTVRSRAPRRLDGVRVCSGENGGRHRRREGCITIRAGASAQGTARRLTERARTQTDHHRERCVRVHARR